NRRVEMRSTRATYASAGTPTTTDLGHAPDRPPAGPRTSAIGRLRREGGVAGTLAEGRQDVPPQQLDLVHPIGAGGDEVERGEPEPDEPDQLLRDRLGRPGDRHDVAGLLVADADEHVVRRRDLRRVPAGLAGGCLDLIPEADAGPRSRVADRRDPAVGLAAREGKAAPLVHPEPDRDAV